MPKTHPLQQVYRRLFTTYGPQHWWPAKNRFEVMVGAILTQNTAWTNVESAIANLKAAHCLTPRAIISLSKAKLAKHLTPSGYFNVKAQRLHNYCQWYLEHGEYRKLAKLDTNTLRHALLSVNGVGPETADDILLYAFARPVFVIDAYARRLLSRYGLIQGDEGYETLRHYCETNLKTGSIDDVQLFNEYHALIVIHAKRACRKKPLCENCCLNHKCSYNTVV